MRHVKVIYNGLENVTSQTALRGAQAPEAPLHDGEISAETRRTPTAFLAPRAQRQRLVANVWQPLATEALASTNQPVCSLSVSYLCSGLRERPDSESAKV